MSTCKYILFFLFYFGVSFNSANAQLRADFDVDVTSVCINPVTTVHFYDKSTGGATSWAWKFNYPATSPSSTQKNPSFIFTSPGTYSVSLTVGNGTTTSTITKTALITVYPHFPIDFSATPTIGCPPLTVNFSNTSSPGGSGSNTYLWYLGPGASPATSTVSAPTGVIYNSGPNDVTLKVTNSYGCYETKTKTAYISVYSLPVVNFSADKADFCSSPGTANFTANITGKSPFTYSWKFGDGNTASGSPASNTYNFPPNSYSPKLIVTDGNGCKDSLTRVNYINYHTPVANFTMPASVCEGSEITFTNTSTPAGGSSSWSFGSTANSPTKTFYTSGTMTITLTYVYKGCTSVVSKPLIVNPKPIADFTINPDTLCPAPVNVQFIPNASYSSYYWDFGTSPAATSGSASPTFTYNKNGLYTPTLVVTTAGGCKDTITKPQFVKIYNIILTALPPQAEGCKPLTINFNASVITNIPDSLPHPYPYPIQTYDWDWGDGTSHGSSYNPAHTYNDTGTFTVTLTITTKQGCTKTAKSTVKVGLKPHADFSANPTHMCIKGITQFTDLTTGPVNNWFWAFGDGSTAMATQNPIYRYDIKPGIFTVTLVSIHNGCSDTMIKPYYIIVDSPKAIIEAKPSCDTPTKLYFKNKSLGASSFVWMFGDPLNTTSTLLNPVFQYPSIGNYTVRLATYNSTSGCRDTASYPVIIANKYATITANDTTVCKNDSVMFTAALFNGNAKDYSWYIDNVFVGTKSFDPTFQHYFFTTGYHTVKVVITDDIGCNTSLTKTNYILVSRPTVRFGATPRLGCTPLNVVFTDSSTVPTGANIVRRYWVYTQANNDTAVKSSTVHAKTYNNAGFFDVKLIITDDIGCKDSLTLLSYIQANKPDAAFSVIDTACIGDSLQFTDMTTAGISSYSWDFGDGSTSILKDPKHPYKDTGSYTVTLLVVDTIGCRDTVTVPYAVTIVKPNPDFTMSDSSAVCPPLYVTFTNTSTKSRYYNWSFGNGNSSTFTNPKNLFTSPADYSVILRATDIHGCVDSVIKHVRIYGYAGAFTYAPLTGCVPLQVTFTANVTNVAGMEWDFSDGNVIKQMGNTITHTYTSPGAFIPKLVLSDVSGCKALSEGLDTIRPDAVYADFIADAPCEYHNVTLLDTSGWAWATLVKWSWTFHDGLTSNLRHPKHYYGPPGKYPVKLYVENAIGCKDSITKDLIIHPPPIITAGGDTIICLKDSTHLHAGGGISYLWNTTPYLSCLNCGDPFAKPTEPFLFVVTGTDSFNCTNTDSILVGIKTKVTAIASTDGEICLKESIQLQVKGASSYQWSPSDGLNNAGSATPVATPTATTRYRIVSFEGSCIPDTDYVKVTVHPLPDVKATGAATIIAGNSTNIQATGNLISKFKWIPSENLSCDDCPDPTAGPKKTTIYLVKVYSEHNCVDSDKVTVKVLCDESQIFLPNTFTPNGDGQNDVFYPRGVGLSTVKSFRIFNRWGEVVFEKQSIVLNDESSAWDGKFKGTVLPPDVYVYTLDAVCDEGETMTIKGDVTIVR